MNIELGKFNQLEVVKEVEFGVYLDVGQKVRLQVRDGHEAQQQDHDDRNKDGERLFDTEFFHDFPSISFLCRRAAKGTPQLRQHPLNASYHSYYTRGNLPCNSPEVNI